MSIKYYHLAKDETPPEEFCAVRDVGGEPSEYMFYVPEAEIIRCKDCKHAHITVDGRSNKWCDCIATHSPEDWSADPPNGYDPEPYFDVDFFCAWGERREDE